MRRLNERVPRLAGLLALALGAVALLALSGVAAAKDRHGDDHGHHGHHHHHFREMREAGTISSFDPTTGKLTIALTGGETVFGLVTEETQIKCEGVDDRLDHGGGDNSGPGSGDDNGGHSEPGDDNGGRGEPGDDNGGRGEPEPGDDHGGQNEPGGEVAPGEASCGVASLVPGAFVGEADLRLGSGAPVFLEIELGHDS
jgi:hypothetical protein